MQIRFHLDESVSRPVAVGLRQREIDVTTSADAKLIGAADVRPLAYALSQHRVIVSHEDDFPGLHHSGEIHAGIAYCRQRSRTIREIIRRLVQLWRVRSAEEMRGRVECL